VNPLRDAALERARGGAYVVSGDPIFVPDRLRERDQFVAYRFEKREDKKTKVPYCAVTGGKASTTRLATWASFDAAHDFAIGHDWVDGIGFVFSPDDGIAGIDLDHCRNPETGAIEEWAQTIIKFFDSYAEASPSGTGVHILVGGVLAGGGRNHDRIEIYDRGRYFTLTGQHIDETPWTVEDRQEQLDELYGLLGGSSDNGEPPPVRTRPASSDASQRLQIALASKNGPNLRRLLDGNNGEYGDNPSDADMAACCILAWYLDHDEASIDEVIRVSARFRPKWDERHYADGETYGDHTIREAIKFVGPGCYGDGKMHFVEVAERPPAATAPKFVALTVDEWLNLEDDAADVVIGDGGDGFVLSIDGKGAIAGGPGIGKSNLLLRLSRCLAEGVPFLQLPIPRPRRVLYLAAEGSKRGIRKRMAKVWADATPEVRERFHLGLVQVDLLQDEATLDAVIEEHRPEVIILDPLRNAHTLDENSSQDVARLIAVLDRMIARHGCAVILAHHGRKEHPLAKGEPGIDNVRGSTALTGWLSFVLTVRRKPKQSDVLLADWVKVRDAEEALPALELEFLRSTIDFKAATRSEEADLAEIVKTLVFRAGSIRTPDLLPQAQALSNRGAKAIRAAIAELVRVGDLVKARLPGDKADTYRIGEGRVTHEEFDED
jgi:putative DNA primase/helicase